MGFTSDCSNRGRSDSNLQQGKGGGTKADVGRRTIFRWANAGMLTRHKINDRVVRFDESEVPALVESARVVSRRFAVKQADRRPVLVGDTKALSQTDLLRSVTGLTARDLAVTL